MFSTSTIVALVSLAAAANAGVMMGHHRRFAVPSTYDAEWLEPYNDYHVRYLALSCHTQHNSTFFDQCCHPMLKGETLASVRPQQCIPSPAASSSAEAAAPSSTIVPDGSSGDDTECADDGEPASSSAPAPVNVAADPNAGPSTADSSTAAPAATTTTEKKTTTQKTTTTAAPTNTPSSSKNSLFSAFSTTGSVHTGGIGTFFFQNGVAGNCGTVHQDSEMLIALPTNTYNNGALCGRKIAVANVKTGVTAVGIVADSCPTCDNDQCLDMSTGLYDKFATRDQGVFDLAWTLID